ncbi:hypothetical protein [Acidovorax sp. T1]|uniref:hypothetical protein n=1 Tax=Acidovorax sp. T1 TaxID=1858609 RepID=UPI0012FBD680|nr:hypothetical protein [Acidovorax sp. T1]
MATIKVTIRQKRIVYDDSISLTSFDGETRDLVDDESDPLMATQIPPSMATSNSPT